MIRILIIFLLIFTGCSSDNKTSLPLDNSTKIIKKSISKKQIISKNFNANLEVILNEKPDIKKNGKLKNNLGRQEIENIKYIISNFKFKKIKNFSLLEPNIIFTKEGIIFFEKKGNLIKFDYEKNIIWKKNYYTKQEKKLSPLINFGSNKEIIIVTDSLSKYYAIDKLTGNLLWSKTNASQFNSEIKVVGDKFYVIDKENIIYCYSTKNGKKIWSYKTENFFIKSNKKLSIVFDNEKIIFNNSIGDITALDANKGFLIWQTPTQNNQIYAETISLRASSLVVDNNFILFSNNKNEFYSLDKNDGFINWKQTINSDTKPLVSGELIFSVSNEGLLFIIDLKNGNIIKTQDLFTNYSDKKRISVKPIGISSGVNKIFITLSNGRLLVVDLKTGNVIKNIKIDSQTISPPYIFNKKVYIIKNNSIIELS
ncbi:PQQ-binding-like beta-propeller repeat protein [Candidatus Pelagibacter sp.]|nr:PQQ-binding-like beta-propeller repeat protein [Candidatus Pelagibacter sp.]